MMAALIEKLTSRRMTASRASKDAHRALQELRSMGARLRDERADLEARPLPLSTAQDGASEGLLREAETILRDLYLAPLIKPVDGRAPSLRLTPECRADLTFVAGVETIAATVSQRLADYYDELGLTGISEDDRAAQIAKIEADLLAAELAEESVIREMEADGVAVLRRPDADPRALLAHDTD